jgi:ELWxxDGT repeat protein
MSGTASVKAVFATLFLLLIGAAGQAQTAFLVKDLNTTRSEGIGSERSPNVIWDSFVALGETVFFGASDGIHGFELWRSDGTAAGTRLVADVCPGSCASLPRNLAVAGGKVFFVADDGFNGPELLTSDASTASSCGPSPGPGADLCGIFSRAPLCFDSLVAAARRKRRNPGAFSGSYQRVILASRLLIAELRFNP